MAVNVILVPVQIVLPGMVAILTNGVTVDVTVIVAPVDVAVGELAQASDDVITIVTISPFAKLLLE